MERARPLLRSRGSARASWRWRSHVDVCDDRLLAVEALLEVKKRVPRPGSTSSWWPFRRTGLLRSPDAEGQPPARARLGGRGGRRHPASSSGPWPTARPLCAGCARSRRSGGCASTCIATRPTTDCRAMSRPWRRRRSASASRGGSAGSHLTSMHSMDNYYVSKLLPLMAEAGMAAIANPLINITIQGRPTPPPSAGA